MHIITHELKQLRIAEIRSDEVVIKTLDDGLALLGDLYYQGYDQIILYEEHLTPEFFDLKTRLAGDILQKFSQYHMAFAIIGDFSKFKSKSLNDFIYESNRGKLIHFVRTLDEVLN